MIGDTIVPVDQLAVVCERQAAEELLKTAIDHYPDAVPIIVEAIESGSR